MPKKLAEKLPEKSAQSRQRRKRLLAEKIAHEGSQPSGTTRGQLRRLSPESPEARDEGPRLIPFSGPDFNRRELGIPSLPTDGYVSLADKAMKMWERAGGKRKKRAKT